MYDPTLESNTYGFTKKILLALNKYKKRMLKKNIKFLYPTDESKFLEHCLKCDFCNVYDNYLVVADVGAQWWDYDTPVLFEALVLSIGEHKSKASFLDALEHYKQISGCKYISFGTQSMEANALGKVLEEHGYTQYGGFYCKE